MTDPAARLALYLFSAVCLSLSGAIAVLMEWL